MPLYTRTGDSGSTQLYGGSEVKKSDARIHAYGTVDELSALIGVILSEGVSEEFDSKLTRIQVLLHRVGADLATPLNYEGKAKRVTSDHVAEMEQWIDEAESAVPPLTKFILPGGSKVAALLHQARTVCRRAERWVVTLSQTENVNDECLKFLNRLGDYLFALARQVNHEEGTEERIVQ